MIESDVVKESKVARVFCNMARATVALGWREGKLVCLRKECARNEGARLPDLRRVGDRVECQYNKE